MLIGKEAESPHGPTVINKPKWTEQVALTQLFSNLLGMFFTRLTVLYRASLRLGDLRLDAGGALLEVLHNSVS